MRRCFVRLLVVCLFVSSAVIASADTIDKTNHARTVIGDLCSSAIPLAASHSLEIDLCQAWNDYDPGANGCSPCSLPGPEIVATLDAQPGEMIRVTTSVVSGTADVRVYLATDCENPAGTCLAAMSGPTNEFHHTLTAGGEVFLYLDTTGECATVRVTRETPASSLSTTFSALKAVYR